MADHPLATHDLLARLSDADRDAVLAIAVRRSDAAGAMIVLEGDLADSFFLITAGRVAVRVSTPNGDIVTLTVLGPDDTFGEVALLGGYRRRTASIIALEPTDTLVVSRREFDALRERQPAVERFLVAVLTAQVARLTAQVTEALFVPVETRLARRLCNLVEVYGTVADGATPATLVLPLTQADLASMVGTSRQTCNRILRKFAAQGLVQLDRGRTEVLDLIGLRRLAAD